MQGSTVTDKRAVKAKSHKQTVNIKRLFKHLEPYIYLLPAFLIFFLFVYYPFFKTIVTSFQLTNIAGKAVEFVGLKNYKELFLSPEFHNSLLVTVTFVVLMCVPAILGGLGLALLAQQKLKGIGAIRMMYAMPMAVSTSCAAVIWTMMYHPSIGVVNYILGKEIPCHLTLLLR
ncbi:carbohydrate ABC transporter permease [Ectobacillus antri]|uniref:carbohydrate ABC transporter permease n=1 Tax=Ectobacillus antri TaxID=2486280 RepID=UPI000F5B78F1|nr:sugar ABC transporter permease [Ectobacillus antri]